MILSQFNKIFKIGYVPYSEALTKANEFMENSGIRRYCQVCCGGMCCKELRCDENNCKQKIQCCTFVCSEKILRHFHTDGVLYSPELRLLMKMKKLAADYSHLTGKCNVIDGYKIKTGEILYDIKIPPFPSYTENDLTRIKIYMKKLYCFCH